jgi:hypothetical protein
MLAIGKNFGKSHNHITANSRKRNETSNKLYSSYSFISFHFKHLKKFERNLVMFCVEEAFSYLFAKKDFISYLRLQKHKYGLWAYTTAFSLARQQY